MKILKMFRRKKQLTGPNGPLSPKEYWRGWSHGKREGFDEGYAQGYNDGEPVGYARGIEAAKQAALRTINKGASNGEEKS